VRRLLLDDCLHPVPPCSKVTDQPFGLVVASDDDSQIDVAGEARLGPGRDGQGADDGPPATEIVQVAGRLAKDRLQSAQGCRRGPAARMPAASPNSAPGRV
jgi:hypothetical protein